MYTAKTLMGVTFAVLMVATPMQAEGMDAACSLDMFKGMYVGLGDQVEVPDEDGERPLYPVSGLLMLYADGAGSISQCTVRQKASRTQEINDYDFDAGKRELTKWGESVPTEMTMPPMTWTYTVEEDCSGMMILTLPNGNVGSRLDFALVNGGRKVIGIRRIPHVSVGSGIFTRIDGYDDRMEQKVDALEAEIAYIKTLVIEMAVKMDVIVRPH